LYLAEYPPPAIAMIFRLIACILLTLCVSSSFAEEPLRYNEESYSGMDDAYYDAMLRSINLDRSRWKSFSKSLASGPWFYDTQSIAKRSGRVTVLVMIYPNPHNTQIYSSICSDHSKIRRIKLATEIDCARKTYRQTHIQSFGYDEQIVSEYAYKNSEQKFSAIQPATMTDTLQGIICNGSRKSRK
jgi:hypothetical protein